MSLASICRSAASASPRTTSRNCSVTDDVILSHSRQSWRRAGGRLAFPAPAGSRRRRGTLERGETLPAQTMSASPTNSTSRDEVKPIAQPAPKPPRATRPTQTVGHRDRGLAARSLHHLRQTHPAARSARSRRHAAVGSRSRLGDPRRARRIHPDVCGSAAGRCRADAARHRRQAFRAADGASRSASALWWPRFQRIAGWFADWEHARRDDVDDIDAETQGKIEIPLDNARTFILSARADRIEQRRDGSFAILDYKTGQPPTGKQVRMGLSPQLTLEAAILRQGGFEDIAAGRVRRRTRLCQAQRQQSAGRAADAGTEDPQRRYAAGT